MATKKNKETVTVGSHLTVYTDANGRTRLEWDDEQLMKDVKQALDLFAQSFNDNMKPAVGAKTAKRTKKQ